MVTVPAEGDKFPVAPTMRAPLIVKFEPVDTVPFTVNPVNVKVPELLIDVADVSIVIVPVGAKVFPEETVMALLMVIFALGCESGVSDTVNP